MSSIDKEQLLTYLQETNNNNSGRSLYSHIFDLLNVLVHERPNDALSKLEELSVKIKNEQYNPQVYNEIDDTINLNKNSESYKKLEQALNKTEQLLKTSRETAQARVVDDDENDDNNDDDEEEVECGDIPDIMTESQLLQWAGIKLDEEECFKLLLSLKQLGTTDDGNIATIRFFGKIFGTEKDYYICETTLREYPEPSDNNEDSKVETSGNGANTYVYYVCNELGQQWRKLPDVLPQQIKKARFMRRFFTGNLDNEVKGFPYFPWSEASYLRAQIARIVAATTVAPSGYYVLDEESEDPAIIADEEFEGTDISNLKDANGWVHSRPHLLKQGRCQPWEAPEEDEEDDDDESKNGDKKKDTDDEEPEEPKPLLSTITERNEDNEDEDDENESKSSLNWSFRMEPSKSGFSHRCGIIKSLKWPGAVCVAKPKSFVNVYIGWGQKKLENAYAPPLPPIIQKEWTDKMDEENEEEEVSGDEEEVQVKKVLTASELIEQTDPIVDPNPPEPEEENEESNEDDDDDDDEEED